MDKYKVPTELDDEEVLKKLDALLHRHKNQSGDENNADVSPQAVSSLPDTTLAETELISVDEIPTLTEVVSLQSGSLQAQTGRTLSLQQILDSALDEVNIEMKTADRIMLTKALEKQLAKIE